MITMLVLFAAILNVGWGPSHQFGTSRPMGPTPQTIHRDPAPAPIPAIKCNRCV
jgi:hypothetical protein